MGKKNKWDKSVKIIKSNKENVSGVKVADKDNSSNVPSKAEDSVGNILNNGILSDNKRVHVWLITALTNLHVGDENISNYGIIDNAVQRDTLTGLPCINSSSLKGALSEFCCIDMAQDKRMRIFGSDKRGENMDSRKGKSIFFDAQLLFLPRQEDKGLYSYVTSREVLALFEKKVSMLVPRFSFSKMKAEGNIWSIEKIREFFNLQKELTIFDNHEDFSELCSDENLPIIARNVLKNGISQNLWYEQVLPSQTKLVAITIDEDETLAEAIAGKIIQIGANATIGYGYCSFSKLGDLK